MAELKLKQISDVCGSEMRFYVGQNRYTWNKQIGKWVAYEDDSEDEKFSDEELDEMIVVRVSAISYGLIEVYLKNR